MCGGGENSSPVVLQHLKPRCDIGGVVVGELAGDFPCALRARQIIDFSMGLALRARLGVGRDLLLVDAEQSVELFFR
jgi:hypothetical protein